MAGSAKKGVRHRHQAAHPVSGGRSFADWELCSLCGLMLGALLALAFKFVHLPSPPTGPTDLPPGDQDENCAKWAKEGECAQNPVYMLTQCRFSCGKNELGLAAQGHHWATNAQQLNREATEGEVQNITASHSPEQCRVWRQRGECDVSVPFMQIHCPHTCGFGLSDMQRHCKYWAQNGECARSMAFMEQQCQASCNAFFRGEAAVNASIAWARRGQRGDAYAPKGPPERTLAAGSGPGSAEDTGSELEASELTRAPDGASFAAAEAGSAPAPFQVGRGLLQSPPCMPLGDQRSDCGLLAREGECSGDHALETMQRCFFSCSGQQPEAVLQLLRKYPDPRPLDVTRQVAPIESLGPLSTLRGLCMGGDQRPPHEPVPVWRRRLLHAFGPRVLGFCTPRRRQMTPRVATSSGLVRQVVTVAARGESTARHVTVVHVLDVPRVRLLHNFLSDREVTDILDLARPLFRASPTLSSYRATVRNSSTAILPREPAVVQRITALVAHFAGVPKTNVENLQVVHYQPGQMYEPHYDFLDQCELANRFTGGRRMMTFLVYMNNLEKRDRGGSTRFPRLGLSVRPQRHTALVFDNYDEYGNEDMRMLHSGDTPRTGDKYAINVWMRTSVFNPAFSDREAATPRVW